MCTNDSISRARAPSCCWKDSRGGSALNWILLIIDLSNIPARKPMQTCIIYWHLEFMGYAVAADSSYSWPLRYISKMTCSVGGYQKLPSPGSWYSNSNWPIQNCSIGDSTSLENSSLLMAPSPDVSIFRKSICTWWKSNDGAQAQETHSDWCPKCKASSTLLAI